MEIQHEKGKKTDLDFQKSHSSTMTDLYHFENAITRLLFVYDPSVLQCLEQEWLRTSILHWDQNFIQKFVLHL